MPITFECAGNGRALLQPRPLSQPWLTEAVGTAEWGGTPLKPLLDEAGVQPGAVEALFAGLDSGFEGGVAQAYERALSIADAEGALLAYEMNGAPLPPQHGFPLRLVVPGWYGMTNVKWLARITLLEEPFAGYQNSVAYRMYDADGEPGEPVTRMLPRSLMVPPGRPDFMSRERHLEPGPATIAGRAWSGFGAIERVEVSTDDGASFADARLDEPLGDAAWRGWQFDWEATEGEHVLCSRATDAAGNAQPLSPPWNLKGYANNAVERIAVTVGRRRLGLALGSAECAPSHILPRPCASSPASSRPAASTSATTSGRSAATSRVRSAPTRRSTASSTCTRRAWPTTRRRSPATCSTRRRC